MQIGEEAAGAASHANESNENNCAQHRVMHRNRKFAIFIANYWCIAAVTHADGQLVAIHGAPTYVYWIRCRFPAVAQWVCRKKVSCIGLYNYSGKMNSNLARRDGPMRNERTVDYLFALAVRECVARSLRTVSALYRGKKQIWRAPIHLRGNNDAGVYACIQHELVIAPRICMLFFIMELKNI